MCFIMYDKLGETQKWDGNYALWFLEEKQRAFSAADAFLKSIYIQIFFFSLSFISWIRSLITIIKSDVFFRWKVQQQQQQKMIIIIIIIIIMSPRGCSGWGVKRLVRQKIISHLAIIYTRWRLQDTHTHTHTHTLTLCAHSALLMMPRLYCGLVQCDSDCWCCLLCVPVNMDRADRAKLEAKY